MQIIKPYAVSSANLLSDLYNWAPNTGVANSTPMIAPKLQTQTQTLPNGGGTYNAAGSSTITPAPIFTGTKPVAQKAPQRNFYKNGNSYFYSDTNQKILNVDELKTAAKSGVEVAPPAGASKFAPIAGVNYDKYRDPKTGNIMTPEEYAIYLGNKVPKGNGEITNYAGDALTNPNQTAAELTARATTLNNSRNDIATGTTDPYKVGNQSGVAYSPTELKAIENAYAGVYDPALQDVFARLKETQEAEKAKADLEAAKELKIFSTNEAIRQWRATTGTKTGAGKEKPIFSDVKLADGASNAGLGITAFDSLDDDIKNFYINSPSSLNAEGKKVPIYQNFEEDLMAVANGELDGTVLAAEITSQPLPEAVKHYFIDQIPNVPVKEKETLLQKIWSGAKSIIGL